MTRTIRRYRTDWKARHNPMYPCAMLKHASVDKLRNECKQQIPKGMHKPGQASYKSNSNSSSMKLIVVEEVKKFSAFYEIWMFMTVLIRTSQWNLSSDGLVHTSPARPALILSSYVHLVPPSEHFPSGFPTTIMITFFFMFFAPWIVIWPYSIDLV